MSQVRSFKSPDAERQFYQILERYEVSQAPVARGHGLAKPFALMRRWAMGRWLTVRLLFAAGSRGH